MYSDEDLDAAVEAGILPAQTARAFRDFVARRQGGNPVDEERFRLLTGFNDIFVSIAIVIFLAAFGWLGAGGAPAIAVASWALSEYFIRRRRMALPGMVLLFGFAGAAFLFTFMLLGAGEHFRPMGGSPQALAASAAAAALAVLVHWRRFHVPVSLAVFVLVVIAGTYFTLLALWPALKAWEPQLLLAGGLAVFAVAMYWDASDRNRSTRRSDVAFWLHMAAAPLIVHPIFSLLGLLGGHATSGEALAAVVLYLILAVVALLIDRRALLVSALAYVLYAVSTLFEGTAVVQQSYWLTALVLGSLLLLLSAAWHRARAALVRRLPDGLQARLPVI